MKISWPGGGFNWKKWGSLFLVILTIGSSGAYSIIQAFQNPTDGGGTQVTLPEQNVITYELTPDQRNYAIKQWKTILQLRYPLAAADVSGQKAYLESMAAQFSDQIILEEIVDNAQIDPILFVNSYYGSEPPLRNPSNDAIFNALCNRMAQPPIQCAGR